MDIDIKKIDAMKIYKPLLPASLKGGAAMKNEKCPLKDLEYGE